MTIKPLQPSAREKKRYIAFGVIGQCSKDGLIKAMQGALLDFLGQLGLAEAGAFIMPETYKNGQIVMRTGHRYVNEAKAAMSLITEIDSQEVIIYTKGISGLIHKAKAGG
ncbi:MAG: Rpp14/Pop5 family protein [Nanoarchaeota archaeon]